MARTVLTLAFLATCVCSAAAHSTGVGGSVINDRTGQPLKGVLVYVENQPVFAETDDAGTFALALAPGQYSVAVSVIGYALLRVNVDVAADDTPPLTIRLSEGAGTYSERVTVAGHVRRDEDQAPGGAALFGRELENLRGVTLDDPLRAVQALPAATATDDFYSEFAVRGDSFRHVGLTVDGIASRFLMHTVNDVADGGSIAMINSETLGAVTLLPGGYPQKTGRRVGAEIDLLTREGNRERTSARAGLSGTSANVLAEGPLPAKRGSWLVSARRSYLDYLINRIDPGASFGFGFTDAQAKLVYDVSSRHQLQITTLGGRAAFADGDADLRSNDNDTASSRAWLGILGWRYTPTASFMVTQKAYATGLRFSNLNESRIPLDTARWSTTGWRVDASYGPALPLLIEFGGDVEAQTGRHTRQRVAASRVLSVPGSYDQTGSAASAYAQARLTARRLSVTPGARIDMWSLSHATTGSPWLSAEYRVDQKTTLRGGTGVYRQFPDFDQVFGERGGGTHLHPERAVHVDIGIDRQLGTATRLQVTGYARQEAHILWPVDSEARRLANGSVIGARSNAAWVNALDGRGRGLEVLLRRDTGTGLSGWAGYAFSRLRYENAGTGESFWANADQRHTLTLYGHYRLSPRTSVGAKYRYGSNYPIAGYLADPSSTAGAASFADAPPIYTLSDLRNTLRLPAYSRADLRADRAFAWAGTRRIVLFAEVANVFNHTNVRNTPYSVNGAGQVFGATEKLMPIIPSAGFVVEF